jgi:hypothetical protein
VITDADLQFHLPDPPDFGWAETGYFNFYIPEANILGFVYIVHRAGVGATVSDVEIVNRASTDCLDTLYVDLCNHNPLPARADRFVLETGLEFEATSIRDYRLAYDRNGVAFEIVCTGLMEPYDIHDPAMDPLAIADPALAIANSGFGAAYTAHFDMAVRVTGALRLGDRTWPIDCISTMDHSWGPRREDRFAPMVWANAHFDDGTCFHGIFAFDPAAPPGGQHVFKHGYALVDGRVRGGKAGSLSTTKAGLLTQTLAWTMIDIDDREHRITGEMLTHHPWIPYGNTYAPLAMIRWRQGDEQTGLGTYLEAVPLNTLRLPGGAA